MGQVEWARDLARTLLEEPLPRRWAHTQGVAAQAETLRRILGNDADLLTAAAWLHDIGYSPNLAVTGFHPLDGARYLREIPGTSRRMCRLVAHHTCALVEAMERGMAHELQEEFGEGSDPLATALTYCDMTTGPDGAPISVHTRIREIFERYGQDHVVSRSIRRAAPALISSVEEVHQLQQSRPSR